MSKQIWRLLEPSEALQAGDEHWFTLNREWRELEIGHRPLEAGYFDLVRRRETLPAYPAPRDARTHCPPIGEDVIGLVDGYWARCQPRTVGLTLWYPLPPIPEQAAQAWDARRASIHLTNARSFSEFEAMKREFIAGYEYAKKGGGA